jgi:hypothetical protein
VCVCVCVCVWVCGCLCIPTCESHPGCYGYLVSIVKIQHFCFHGHKFAMVAVYDVTAGISVISKVTIDLGLCMPLQSNLFGCYGSEIS